MPSAAQDAQPHENTTEEKRQKRRDGIAAIRRRKEYAEAVELFESGQTHGEGLPVHSFEQSLGLDPAHPEGEASKRDWERAQQNYGDEIKAFVARHRP